MGKVNKKSLEIKKNELIKSSQRPKGIKKLKHHNMKDIKEHNTGGTLKVCKKRRSKEPISEPENKTKISNSDDDKMEIVTSASQSSHSNIIKNPKNISSKIKTNSVTEIDNDNDDNNTNSENETDSDNEEEEAMPINNVRKKIDPNQNDKTVFVGNIPSNTKVNQLKKLFSSCTVVSCRFRLANGKPILKHKMRKESDSINAWVVFNDKKDVELAIQSNGIEFKGRHIRVTRSQIKNQKNDQNDKCTIFVGNLKYSANDEKLYSIFSSCGEIDFVRTIKNDKGCSGVAYVCFKKPESVGLAMELNKTLLDDRPINVEKYSKNKSGTSKKRKPEQEMSGVERRIMSKLMKDKNQNKDISGKLPFKDFANKRNSGKKFNNKNEKKSENSKKKSEYRGIKVDSKKKFKRKNNKNPLHALAKKIAPKE